MIAPMTHHIRLATPADAPAIGRIFHAFQVEYGDVTPGPDALGARTAGQVAAGETDVLLCGDGPDGFVVQRYRPNLYSPHLECYLAELYVVPSARGRGMGRALMEAALARARARGADHIDLGTSHDDTVARALYESLGFINTEGGPDGPVMYVYERDL